MKERTIKDLIEKWRVEGRYLSNPDDSAFDRAIGTTYFDCANELEDVIKEKEDE